MSCGMDCDPGFHECDGVCVDNSSPDHCGTRCDPCPAPPGGTATCDGTSCGSGCPEGHELCFGECIDVRSDIYNCGDCDTYCDDWGSGGTAICVNGECDLECPEGLTACDGVCLDTSDDIYNCGACGNVCEERAPECRDGECTCDYWCGDHTFTVCCFGYECCPDGYCTTYGCL
jgi:hypothetical protein